jgi:histidine triad (HIT) family protein
MPSDPECVFCKIVQGKLPAAKVLETPAALAFLDIQPLAQGHVLLVPKEHYATLADIPPPLLAEVTAELPRLSRALASVVGAPALTLAANNGREADQLVPHLHFHLIPRRADDGLLSYATGSPQSEADRDALREQIAAALAGQALSP